ncbi:MAG: hypothetical protein GY833_12610 [Aestuariibacter sp.]|nr:hypothetical protein [Aestuariibacter sp.]|tara:strand:+ start:115305 stop:115697 length:393 start_codon:yes stop_codon:yes gene_type:complete
MSKTIIGQMLEKHAIEEGVVALEEELVTLEAEHAAIEEELEKAESDEAKAEIEERRMSSQERIAAKKRRLQLKRDPSYRKAVKQAAKLNKGLDKPKYSVQRDDETGNWVAAKIDLALSKKARQAAKTRRK